MVLTVKTDDVTSGRKDVDPHGRLRREWVNVDRLKINVHARGRRALRDSITSGCEGKNELKPRQDNDSDQVSYHDKAVVGESVHV